MRATSFGSKPCVATGDSVLPSFEATQTIRPVASSSVLTRASAPSARRHPRARTGRRRSPMPPCRRRLTLGSGRCHGRRVPAAPAVPRGAAAGIGFFERFLELVAPLGRILHGRFRLGRHEQQRDHDPDRDGAAGERDLFRAGSRRRADRAGASSSSRRRLHLRRGRRRQQVADFGEDHIAGEQHLVAADVGARAALGGAQLIDRVERFGERSADRRRDGVESRRASGAARRWSPGRACPRRAGPGRARRRRAARRAGRAAARAALLTAASDAAAACRSRPSASSSWRVRYATAGGNQQTDHEAGDANGPAKHREDRI